MAHIKSLHALNVNFLLACFVLLLSSAGFSAEIPDSASYGIDVWYGKRQVFGRAGTQQPLINIVGQVRHVQDLYHLSYMFQRKRFPLPVGPTAFRLALPGEFNIEIDRLPLPPGEYPLQVIATYKDGTEVRERIVIIVEDHDIALPYTIAWQQTPALQDAGQVIDGLWEVTGFGVRNTYAAYDRAIAIGDWHWKDYEVCLPFIIHEVSADSLVYGWPSTGAALHIAFRWQGHRNWNDILPRRGWTAFGALFSYEMRHQTPEQMIWVYDQINERSERTTLPRHLETNTTYQLRARVQTKGNGPSEYRMKIWPASDDEPDDWDLVAWALPGEIQQGSILLIAHQAVISFGDVLVTDVSTEN